MDFFLQREYHTMLLEFELRGTEYTKSYFVISWLFKRQDWQLIQGKNHIDKFSLLRRKSRADDKEKNESSKINI